MSSLDYPNLATCKIRLKGGAASARPPVVLPRAVRDAATRMEIDDSPYDFSLGKCTVVQKYNSLLAWKWNGWWMGTSRVIRCADMHSDFNVRSLSIIVAERHVLKRKDEREQDRIVQKASSREELQSSTITKMKNLTGADESVCVAILEKNNYDVTTSIEAFFIENGS